MNEHNEKRAERLFDAIGGIDDRLIQDAMSPKKARDFIASRRRMRISITAVACLFCLVIGALIRLPDLGGKINTDSPDRGDEQSNTSVQTQPTPDKNPAPNAPHRSLEQVLNLSSTSAKVTYLSADKLELRDSRSKLIWQFEGDDGYNVVNIDSQSKLDTITAQLDSPAFRLNAESSEKLSVKLWIAYGDGRIVSPYLVHAPGNTGIGALFDYNAEVEPSAKLTEAILQIIE